MRLLLPLWLLSLAAGAVVHDTATELRPARSEDDRVDHSPLDGNDNLKTVQKLIDNTKILTGELGTTMRTANAVVSQIGGVLQTMGPTAAAILEIVNNFVPGVSFMCHPRNIRVAKMRTARPGPNRGPCAK